jgi:cysteine desulfurase
MFGKLLKYEFKSTAKWYLLITLIALGLSVITGVIGGSATNGFVDMEQIKTDYKDGFENPVRTSLVSIMLANNEIGTIEPIRNIAMVAHRKGVLFHTDAVQAFGHIPIDVNYLGVDMLSASSHKFNGPKGVGFLYVRNPKEMMPLIYGGGQEKGKRGGTENVAGIIGMGAAVEDSMRNMSARYNKEKNLRDYMVKRILGEIPNVSLNGHYTNRLPGNASFTFDGINGTSLVVIMDEEGVCISAGSACAASAEKPSHVISALGIPKEKAYGTIRITIGHENTRKEIDYTVEKLKASVKELRAKS